MTAAEQPVEAELAPRDSVWNDDLPWGFSTGPDDESSNRVPDQLGIWEKVHHLGEESLEPVIRKDWS